MRRNTWNWPTTLGHHSGVFFKKNWCEISQKQKNGLAKFPQNNIIILLIIIAKFPFRFWIWCYNAYNILLKGAFTPNVMSMLKWKSRWHLKWQPMFNG